MKTKKLISFLIAILLISGTLSAQPKFLLNVNGGLSIPLPDLKGDVATVPIATSFEKDYGMKLGVNFGAHGKYAFDKDCKIRGVLGLTYNIFMNPGEYASVTGSYKYKPMINIFTTSLGIEYAFQPKEKYSPFIGADFTANFFSGSFDYDPPFTSIPNISLTSATRFGLQFNLGTDVAINENIGIVVGMKYHLANLIGKDSDTSALSLILPNERPLNDGDYTYAGKTVSAKNISYVQFYAGLTFFFNQQKKTK
ncbi:outer membrane beta-barrel protein [Bacteroidota bacterium]